MYNLKKKLPIKKLINFSQVFLSRVCDKILLKNFSFKNFSRLFFLGFAIALIVLFFDLLSKKIVFDIIEKRGETSYINTPQDYQFKEIKITSFFSLVRVWNKGVSFGMFSNLKSSEIIFSFIQGGIGLALLFWLYQVRKIYLAIALGLVIGGAFGNTIDRIINGAVADFLDFYYQSYHWPAFNLADSAIFVGIVILILDEFYLTKNRKK